MDDSISPGVASSDVASGLTEIPVPVDTLTIGGVDPDKGDPVTVKVDGDVTRIINGVAYVRVKRVNDQPLPGPVVEPTAGGEDEMDRLERLSHQIELP